MRIQTRIASRYNPEKLFFLVIILPVIVVSFVVYGLFSAWAYRQTIKSRGRRYRQCLRVGFRSRRDFCHACKMTR